MGTRNISAAVQQSRRIAHGKEVVPLSDFKSFGVVLEAGGDGCGIWVGVRVEGELRSSRQGDPL